MGQATQDLRKEHDAILHVLNILDKMTATNTVEDAIKVQYYRELVYFLQIFADKCHHGKEENYLFEELSGKGLSKAGGPIGVMLQEHIQGREYIAHMNKSLESNDIAEFTMAALKYRDLLQSHIAKENDVLFVMADKLLDEARQTELYEEFERYEELVIGHGIHEELHAMIHKWSEIFGG